MSDDLRYFYSIEASTSHESAFDERTPSEISLQTDDGETCHLEVFSTTDAIRMLLNSGLGSVICFTGITFNMILLVMFSRLSFHNTNYLYLYILAFFDIIVEVCFIMIFSAATYYEYFYNYELYVAWHNYIRLFSTVGQVLIIASSVLIVLASFERYMCSSSKSPGFDPRTRTLLIFFVILYAFIVKGTVWAELRLIHAPECAKFSDWHITQSSLADQNSFYYTMWMVHGRNVLCVFLPFSLLCVLNFLTFRNINRKSKHFEAMLLEGPTMLLPQDAQQALAARDRKRDATYTLFALVSVYLFSNLINTWLTFWEYIDKDGLASIGDGWPYRYLADVSSLTSIAATAFRLPIYWGCNRELKIHLSTFFNDFTNKKLEKFALKHEVIV
ncbi:unnamed protein product, partial [Mesorhabditis belari]|uniref:G-protein coupled receptors family 1 profile domain-containing protein n=1 Tax=Mesorhabditis belari TaxID=2138241 RepID=A0AAF3J9D0_9BILA